MKKKKLTSWNKESTFNFYDLYQNLSVQECFAWEQQIISTFVSYQYHYQIIDGFECSGRAKNC